MASPCGWLPTLGVTLASDSAPALGPEPNMQLGRATHGLYRRRRHRHHRRR